MPQRPRLSTLIGFSLLLVSQVQIANGAPRSRLSSSNVLWVLNVGNAAAELQVERSRGDITQVETLLIEPGDATRIEKSPGEKIQVPSSGDTLLVTASAELDIDTILAEGSPGLHKLKGLFTRGQRASAALLWRGSGPLTVNLALHEPHSSADLQLVKSDGSSLGFVNVSTARPVSLKIDLGRMLANATYVGLLRVDLKVLRGQVDGSLATAQTEPRRFKPLALTKVGGGNAWFSSNIHWQDDPTPLYYHIRGGQANTCGELNTFRNGSWQVTPGWACTDGSGNADKGPWYAYNWTSDQKDDPAYIRWPNGTSTTTDWHIFDVECPSTTRTSPYGAPPTTYYGNSADGIWGACFGDWAYVYSLFHDLSTGLFWTPSAGAYSAATNIAVYGVLSGRPGCGVTWDTAFPPVSAHQRGHQYRWTTCVSDGGCSACDNLDFWY
jgi:hypothetical protein